MWSSPGGLAGVSMACGISWTLAAAAVAAQPQAAPAEPAVPTAIEEALIEHACSAWHQPGTAETDAYLDCRKNRLLYLRAEFGRDLRRLSSTERRRIDSACSDLRASRGQDAYVACLAAQLAALPGHGSKAGPAPAAGAALPASAPSETAAPTPVPSSSMSSAVWIGAGLAGLIVIAAAGATVAKMRAKRAFGTCHTCGAKLLERGDLCHACRHEAAETLRRATTERADHARAEQEAQRLQNARENEQQQRAQDDEARRRELEAAQQTEARQQEQQSQLRRAEEARQQRQTDAAATEAEFDPHAVLGVPRGASAGDIELAYQAAKAKLDPDLVADLGADLQEHFKRKGQAARRAYEMLTAHAAPPDAAS